MAWTKISKFSKKSSSKRGRARRGRGRRIAKLPKSVKRAVTSIIRRDQETKCVQYSGSAQISSYGSTVQSQGFIPLTPYATFAAISQGTGQGDRIGDKLRIVKATLSYVLTPNGYNATTNPLPTPQEFVMRLFSVKNTNVLVSAAGNYFQFGNSSQTPTGNLIDIPRGVNTELYSQYRMIRHKLGYAAWIPSPGLVGQQGYYANNDFAMNITKSIDYTKYCPKIIRYNDNTSTPSTRVLQTFIESVNSDNSVSAVGIAPITMAYTISIWFKDA